LGVGSDGTVHVAWVDFTDYGGSGPDLDIFYKGFDVNAPVTVDDYDGQWRTSDFTITLTATDDLSGVEDTYYVINDGPTRSVSSDGQPLITAEGANNELIYYSRDNVGNNELPMNVLTDIKLDKTPPIVGYIVIDGDAAYTSSVSVTLTLSASDPQSGVSEMRFRNSGGSWSTWEAYSTSKSWTLTSGDGTKTVEVQFRNGAGLPSTTYSDTIILDTSPPTGSIVINGVAAYTTSRTVTLTLSASDATSGVYQMRFSENMGAWSSWVAYATTYSYTLTSANDATKRVDVQFKDNAGNPSTAWTIWDGITLDTTPPTGSITINSGATYTTTTSVTLSLTYADATSGVRQVRYSNDGVWDSEVWEGPSSSKSWSLTPGDGTKTVYYQVKDNAGLTSVTYSDTIVLDTVAPTGSVVINDGAASTSSASVTLTLTHSDSGSGVSQVRYSNDGIWDTEIWENPATSKSWTLSGGDGTKTVYYQIKDNAGVLSSTYSDTIILETPPVYYDLTVAVSGSGSTSPGVGTHTYDEGSGFSVTASPGSGWTFDHWLLDAVNVGSANPYMVTMNADHTLTAVFVEVPPSFETLTFDVIVGENTFVVETCSNSSVSDLIFNQALKRIRFNVDGTTGTTGLCNITIPTELMWGTFSIYIYNTPLIKNVDYTETFNATHYLCSITYEHSTHIIEIFATNVIPEFPSFLVLPLFTITLLLAVMISRRKRTM
jgi:hypothetical protein